MNQAMQPAIQHLFQVPTFEAVSREQLQAFVDEYACFGYGHYLLSRKLRGGDEAEFVAATQKTSLYFSNPFWLQWMLEHAPGTRTVPVTAGAHAAPVAGEIPPPFTTEIAP